MFQSYRPFLKFGEGFILHLLAFAISWSKVFLSCHLCSGLAPLQLSPEVAVTQLPVSSVYFVFFPWHLVIAAAQRVGSLALGYW